MAEAETTEGTERQVRPDPGFVHLCKGMTLSVPYAANCGGIATLTGSGTNPIMKGHADE